MRMLVTRTELTRVSISSGDLTRVCVRWDFGFEPAAPESNGDTVTWRLVGYSAARLPAPGANVTVCVRAMRPQIHVATRVVRSYTTQLSAKGEITFSYPQPSDSQTVRRHFVQWQQASPNCDVTGRRSPLFSSLIFFTSRFSIINTSKTNLPRFIIFNTCVCFTFSFNTFMFFYHVLHPYLLTFLWSWTMITTRLLDIQHVYS